MGNRWRWTMLLGLMLIGLALLGCGQSDNRPVIAASIYPLASLVQQVAGDAARVETLLPAGANPHGFVPGQAQTDLLNQATLLVCVGPGIDEWAEQAAKVKPALPLLRMADSAAAAAPKDESAPSAYVMAARGGDKQGKLDPHLWQDLELTARFVETAAGQLGKQFPEQAPAIAERGKTLAGQLRELDGQFRRQMWAAGNKQILTYHDAFDRLARRYSLEVVGHVVDLQSKTGGQASNEQIVAGIALVKQNSLPAIYVEPFFRGEKAVELISQRTGAKVLLLDPMGGPSIPGYDSYQEMMKSNVKTLLAGQQGKAAPAAGGQGDSSSGETP